MCCQKSDEGDKKPRRVVLVSVGDPRTSRAWSGVPQRLFLELNRRGCEVLPLDISSDFWWHWCGVVFNRIFRRVYRPWHRVSFCNTKFGLYLSGRFLRKSLANKGLHELIFCTTFSINCAAVETPCVLLHDWTEGYAILRTGSSLNSCELQSENNQIGVIKASQMSIAIYPESEKYIKGLLGEDYQQKIDYVCNPINADALTAEWVKDRLQKGINSKRILVVGGFWYQRNVECVIKAADSLGRKDIIVDVIGRSSAETQPKYCRVNFYGYLDKDDAEQKSLYMTLFKEARCLVNIRKNWGGGSSVAEAMYDYLPIIVGRYPEIVSMYGEDDSRFGMYCGEEDIHALADKLRAMLDMDSESYREVCVSAHNLVANDTYERLLTEIFDKCL